MRHMSTSQSAKCHNFFENQKNIYIFFIVKYCHVLDSQLKGPNLRSLALKSYPKQLSLHARKVS
jgi:hypothetical protein